MTKIQIPLKDPIVSDPDILGGLPVIKGTRIPAGLVLSLLKRGYSINLIATEYPSLSTQKIKKFLEVMSTSLDDFTPQTL